MAKYEAPSTSVFREKGLKCKKLLLSLPKENIIDGTTIKLVAYDTRILQTGT